MEGISVIIPAYNESKRISKVLEPVLEAQKRIEEIKEVIVVDDGSKDRTLFIAKEIIKNDENSDINQAFTFPINHGKGFALSKGVKASNENILFFLDSDLKNFTVSHIEQLIYPVLNNECDLANGVIDRGKQFYQNTKRNSLLRKAMQTISFFKKTIWKVSKAITHLNDFYSRASLSGIRVLRKEIWDETTPKVDNFYIDTSLYYTAKEKYRIKNIVLKGVTQFSKVEKKGRVKGWISRLKMYLQILIGFIKFKILNQKKEP